MIDTKHTAQGLEATSAKGRQMLLDLYNKSILKKAKYTAIKRYLPETTDKVCLDIGADNGVLSYLLRQRGGQWHSADLDAQVVESIKSMVTENVYQFDGKTTKFEDDFFDLVVIIDFLEHIHSDREFIIELSRIMKPNARLIINVPHNKPKSLIRRLRLALGLTDDKHGHVRPGYDISSLTQLLGDEFKLENQHSYSRFFVEFYDALISFVFEKLQGEEAVSNKGTVVTATDLAKHQKKFRVFSMVYPLVWLLSKLDKILFFTSGYSLIVQAKNTPGD